MLDIVLVMNKMTSEGQAQRFWQQQQLRREWFHKVIWIACTCSNIASLRILNWQNYLIFYNLKFFFVAHSEVSSTQSTTVSMSKPTKPSKNVDDDEEDTEDDDNADMSESEKASSDEKSDNKTEDGDDEYEDDDEEDGGCDSCDGKMSSFVRSFEGSAYLPDDIEEVTEFMHKNGAYGHSKNINDTMAVMDRLNVYMEKLKKNKDMTDTIMYVSSVLSDRMYEAQVSSQCMADFMAVGTGIQNIQIWSLKSN